jgi:hypothetical protein
LFVAAVALGVIACTFASISLAQAPQQLGPWRWSGVQRIVVIPDIHGAYAELTELLQATDIIDQELRWIGGASHLVSLGDLLDRGTRSREVMDLLMRLQREAPESGGRVHVVAGNHEVMNLIGDLRYVSPGEFSAFIDLETTSQRQLAYEKFLARRSETLALSFLGGGVTAAERDPESQRDFEELYPPGYFGHRSGLAPDGNYGGWLLSLPALIVINDTVFVHGGLPAVVASAPIDKLNEDYLSDLRRFFELWQQLIDAGVLTQDSIKTNLTLAQAALRIADPSSCPRDQRSSCARERGAATDRQRSPPPDVVAALKELLALEDSPMFGPRGPLWYRGSVRCKDILEIPLLQSALANLGATRVVVGHTPTTDRRVHQLRNDSLIMLDTGMLVASYQGRPAALIIDGTTLEVQYLHPTERAEPMGPGGNGAYPFSEKQLREALQSAEVLDVEKGWLESSSHVQLAYKGIVIDALFFPADNRQSELRELAAQQLDGLLGFDLVPITVRREINDTPGVLQLAFLNFLSESKRLRQKIAASDWCPLPAQRQLLAVFDVLIGKEDRSSTSYGYTQPYWNLQASYHSDGFGTSHELSGATAALGQDLPPAAWQALRTLDKESLADAIGSLLNDDQIAALLARRDAILAIAGRPAASYDPQEPAARDDRRQ